MKLFDEYLRPLKEVGIESIAKETLIDEYSKKLKLKEQIDLFHRRGLCNSYRTLRIFAQQRRKKERIGVHQQGSAIYGK